MRFSSAVSNKLVWMCVIYVALFIYVAIRAYTLSFTHDESLSYEIINGNEQLANTANNHVLNTTLMALSSALFGNSEFALRLPNVLAFALYLISCFFLCRPIKNLWLGLLGLGLLLLNPFLLEYFSLARGYGISIGLMAVSLVFLLNVEREDCSWPSFFKGYLLSVLFASLASLSNLLMLNYLIAVLLIFNITFWWRKKDQISTNRHKYLFAGLNILSCIPLILGVFQLLRLKAADHLYFGASSFSEAMGSLIKFSVYIPDYGQWVIPTVKCLMFLLILAGVIYLVVNKVNSGRLFILTALVITITFGLFLERMLFEANYPMGRTTLFYVPLLSLFIYYLFGELISRYGIKRRYCVPALLVLTAPLLWNFYVGANIEHTKNWRYDAHTKEVMQTIKDQSDSKSRKQSISNHWLLEPAINYYIDTWGLNLYPADRSGVNTHSDFMYRLKDTTTVEGYSVLEVYDDSRTNLSTRIE